jgi:hypothetical protein
MKSGRVYSILNEANLSGTSKQELIETELENEKNSYLLATQNYPIFIVFFGIVFIGGFISTILHGLQDLTAVFTVGGFAAAYLFYQSYLKQGKSFKEKSNLIKLIKPKVSLLQLSEDEEIYNVVISSNEKNYSSKEYFDLSLAKTKFSELALIN